MADMKQIKVEKVTLNMGVGGPGPNLDKAIKLLETITGKKPVTTKTKKRIPTWGLRPGLPIATKVTLRGKDAEVLLKRLFEAVEKRLHPKRFDDQGNFSFGIKEYLDIPGMTYIIEIGMMGLEVAVTLQRPGFRVKKRRICCKKIPIRHKINKEEAMNFITEKYGVKVQKTE